MSLFCWTQRKIFWRKFVTRLFWGTIDFQSRKTKILCPITALFLTFFRISSFVFGRTKTFLQVWNYLRENDDWIYIFGWTNPFACCVNALFLYGVDDKCVDEWWLSNVWGSLVWNVSAVYSVPADHMYHICLRHSGIHSTYWNSGLLDLPTDTGVLVSSVMCFEIFIWYLLISVMFCWSFMYLFVCAVVLNCQADWCV